MPNTLDKLNQTVSRKGRFPERPSSQQIQQTRRGEKQRIGKDKDPTCSNFCLATRNRLSSRNRRETKVRTFIISTVLLVCYRTFRYGPFRYGPFRYEPFCYRPLFCVPTYVICIMGSFCRTTFYTPNNWII